MLFALVFISLLVESTYSARLGQACLSDSDCPGSNQQCLVIGVPCNATQKACQCRQCFGPNENGDACLAVTLKTPCGTGAGNNCDPTCTIGSQNEIYPPSAICEYGYVACSPRSCFATVNKRCVPIETKKTRQATCDANCECGSNLGCVATCSCPKGSHWDADRQKCTTKRADFGESCLTNADCNMAGATKADDRSNGFSNSGGKCVSGKCGCADGYVRTVTGFYKPEDGSFITKTICVISGMTVNVVKGEKCNVDPIGMSDVDSSLVCDSNTACYACEGEKQANIYGKCRTVTTKLDNCDNARDQTTGSRVKNVGATCTNDAGCGFNEICSSPSVDPPCLTGKCACKQCFGVDNNGFCGLKKKLNVGERCYSSLDEVYPPNMWCIHDVVDCLNDRYKVNAKQDACVVNDYSFVSHGVVCNEAYSNCMPGLYCMPDEMKCDCPHSNQYWNPASGKCETRQIGDSCRYDHDCDDRSKTQTLSSGRVCLNGTCRCGQASYKTRPTSLTTNGLEILPTQCGDPTSVPQSQVCTNCANSPFRKTCAFFNVTSLPKPNTAEIRNQPEICFPGSFPTTPKVAPTTAKAGQTTQRAVPSTPKAASTMTTQKVVSTTRKVVPTTAKVIQTTPKAISTTRNAVPKTTASSSAAQGAPNVGKSCTSNDDCGANEMCFSPYDPICSGTCICKPGYDMNALRACVAKSKLQIGDSCTAYTRPDMFAHPKMFCDFGSVSCGFCPYLTCSGPWSPTPVQEGGQCRDPCDCDGDMVCNMIQHKCMCSSLLQHFDTKLKICVSTSDTTGAHNGVACRPTIGCFGNNMTCDVAAGVAYGECKCQSGYVYDYIIGDCFPRNYGDTCQTNADCKGSGQIVNGHGYSGLAGAACGSDGKCGCATGFVPVQVAFDEVKKLWQKAPAKKTVCLPQSVASQDPVPKGGPCTVNPFMANEDLGICQQGLYCVQCPKEANGKCRVVRDIIQT